VDSMMVAIRGPVRPSQQPQHPRRLEFARVR
jgi:hypothetical protein